jgi:hypothetical protein
MPWMNLVQGFVRRSCQTLISKFLVRLVNHDNYCNYFTACEKTIIRPKTHLVQERLWESDMGLTQEHFKLNLNGCGIHKHSPMSEMSESMSDIIVNVLGRFNTKCTEVTLKVRIINRLQRNIKKNHIGRTTFLVNSIDFPKKLFCRNGFFLVFCWRRLIMRTVSQLVTIRRCLFGHETNKM